MAPTMSAQRGPLVSLCLLLAAVSAGVALLAAPSAAFVPQPTTAGAELRSDFRPSALHSSSTDDADPGLSRRQVGELA